jgi:hypothetical protein
MDHEAIAEHGRPTPTAVSPAIAEIEMYWLPLGAGATRSA